MLYSPDKLDLGDSSLKRRIGGKGAVLLELYKKGFPVPRPFFLETRCYEEFIEHNQLREKLQLLLHRKDLREMRWEEIWDICLRIQTLFLRADIPAGLGGEITALIAEQFGGTSVVVRSSAPGEDGRSQSFAGLHSSVTGVVTTPDILKAIKKVWASLWSDRAILYRQELGLEVESSTMAVVIQELVVGEYSGVVFSASPLDSSQMVIEAVHGLNEKLVDGEREPYRWFLDRQDLRILDYRRPGNTGDPGLKDSQPDGRNDREEAISRDSTLLSEDQLRQVAAMALSLEQHLGGPQDVEWTIANDTLHVLQSRPVTTGSGEGAADKRAWYLSLNRSYDNLLQLWESISKTLLPAMDKESDRFAGVALESLSDSELASELLLRNRANERWATVYWDEFIPFAHGVRLFGEVYNDIVEPEDPFEFVVLLTGQDMLSTRRNRTLYECAQMVQKSTTLRELLEKGRLHEAEDPAFVEKVARLKHQFAMPVDDSSDGGVCDTLIASVILQYTRLEHFSPPDTAQKKEQLEDVFIEKGTEKLPFNPETLLEMARASYRLRDDDNIHIGRIARQLERAVICATQRLSAKGISLQQHPAVEDLARWLTDQESASSAAAARPTRKVADSQRRVYARQLQGQAASTGIASGLARVIRKNSDLKDFRKGEILVIDALDPTMTFFAPLAAGIIERRGGMLIHGAIIAREYGVPCITGVVDAAGQISTGDRVTVDGFLGICTIQRNSRST